MLILAGVQVEIFLQDNPISWKQGSYANTFSKDCCLSQQLLNPCHMHIEFLLADFYVLNGHQVCRRFCSLKMIKIVLK
jgi:hypothetical protein